MPLALRHAEQIFGCQLELVFRVEHAADATWSLDCQGAGEGADFLAGFVDGGLQLDGLEHGPFEASCGHVLCVTSGSFEAASALFSRYLHCSASSLSAAGDLLLQFGLLDRLGLDFLDLFFFSSSSSSSSSFSSILDPDLRSTVSSSFI